MIQIVLPVILLALLLPVHAGNERLIGAWKSNEPLTLHYLRTHTKLTPQQLEKLGTILGKMVIVFDAQNMTLQSGDWEFVSKSKIVEESKTVIVIEAENPETKNPSGIGRDGTLVSGREDSRPQGALDKVGK